MTCFLFMAAAFAACPAWAEDDDTEDTPGVPEAADVPPAPVIAADSDDSSFYDLRRHGAVVGQDCTEVLQRALDTQGQHRKPILLPAGPLLISKTIVAPFKVGGQLLGSGRGGAMKEGSSLDGGVTALVWVGPPGGTVLEMRGGEMEVRDLSIIGRPIGAEGRAGIGILVTKPGKGIGSGKHHFPSLHIEDCEIAIQVGQKPTEHNCDNLVFGYLTVTNCGYGLRVMNAMGMGFKFDYVHTRGVGEMFDFWGGGNLWVDAWKIIAGNVGIHIRDEPGFVAIGKNNASYVCNNLKLDANSKEYKLIQQDGNKPALIVLNHGHIANKVSLEKPFIEVGGNTCVTLRDWYNFKIGKIVAHEIDGVKPNILLDRCRLGAFTEPQEFLIGKGYLKLRDCMVGVTTVPVPDVLIEK